MGRVGPIDLPRRGRRRRTPHQEVRARIPADTKAVVAEELSAVGEQYIDLRPETTASLPRRRHPHRTGRHRGARTGHRRPHRRRHLVSSVPLEDLRTIVDEFGKAFEGHGDDLQVLLDSGSDFVAAADRACRPPACSSATARLVLRTQAQESQAIRELRGRGQGPGRRAQGLRRRPAPPAPRSPPRPPPRSAACCGTSTRASASSSPTSLTTSEVAVTRQRGIEELLVTYPAAVAAGATAVDEGKLNLGLAVTFFSPLPCTDGYGATRYRNGLDLGTAPALNTDAACTAPASSGKNVRGSANAPKSGPVPDPGRARLLPSGSGGRTTPARDGTPAALPGALALPGQSGEAPAEPDRSPRPGHREHAMRRAGILTGAALVLALGVCGTGAWTYAGPAPTTRSPTAGNRDAALADGRDGIAVLTTLDASTRQRAERSIRDWRAVVHQAAARGTRRHRGGGRDLARGTVTEAAVTAPRHAVRHGPAHPSPPYASRSPPPGRRSRPPTRKRLGRPGPHGRGEWSTRH